MCPPMMSGGILSGLWRVVGGQRRETGAPNTPKNLNPSHDLAIDHKSTEVSTAEAPTENCTSSRQVSQPLPVVYSGGARKKVVLPRYYHRGDPSDSEGSSSSGPCSPVLPRRGAVLRYRGPREMAGAEGRRWASNGNSNIVSSASWEAASGVGAAVVAGKGLGGSVTTQCALSSLGATSGPSPPPAQGRIMDKASRHKDAAIIHNISRMSNRQESLMSHPPEPPPLPPTIIGSTLPATSASKPEVGNYPGYLEHIRAFDIYTINRRPSDAPYPPTLPALASQTTDDDTDSDDTYRGRRRGRGCGCVGNSTCVVCDNETLTGKKKIVPRKRKNLDASEVARRKKWCDKDSGEECEEDICPNMHRSNLPRPGPSTDFIQAHTLETNMFMSPIAMQKSHSPTTPQQKIFGGRVVCDVDDDAPSSDDTLSDDDDETSTVVPDDFETDGGGDTDSDIEVLQEHESWVDLSTSTDPPMASTSKAAPKTPMSPDRVAPLPFGNGEEYLRLLREAQKESNHSSARVSLASSRKETPRDSPKSPPNSPNTEMATENTEEAILRGVYINYYNKEGDFIRVEKNTETDWIWDWSSRPDQTPPKEWRFSHPRKGVSRGASIRRVMVGNSSLFSRDVLYTLLITNVLSLILGTGIGIWLSKRSGGASLSTLPIN